MLYKSKPGEGHHHLFFVPEGSEGGVSTKNKDHEHEFLVEGDTVFCLEGGEDGHVHELVKVKNDPPPKLEKEDDQEIISDTFALFKEAHDNNLESYEKAEESEDYYHGNQWDEKEKKQLEKQGRACLTINESGGQIDTLLGFQKNNRSDFEFRPIEESDAKGGLILKEVVKNICETNNFVFEESCVAEDQHVTGRGNFACYVDYDDNIEGDIIIEKVGWRDVSYGPFDKLDRSDCEYLIKQKMFSLARMKRMFPDKADELQKDYNMWQTIAEKNTVSGKEYSLETGTLMIGKTDIPKVNIQKKEYRLVECWRKHFRTEYVLLDSKTGEVENITGVDAKIRKSMASEERFEVIARTVYDMRVTKVSGNVVLSDELVDVPDNDFDVIPVHAKYKNGKWWGKMEDLKDLQDEINHRTSQSIDIVNKSISYTWFFDDNTFNTPADEQDFMDNATTPGFASKLQNTDRPPFQVQGAKMPVEIIELQRLATEKLYRVSNVPMETQGDSKMMLSGAAIREKTQVALQGNRYLPDNMNLAKKLLAHKIVALVQEHYTPERIVRLIRKNGSQFGGEVDPRMQEIQAMPDEDIIKILETTDLMKYDIVVDTSPYSPTVRMSNQILLQELMKQGTPVPFTYFVQQSDLPDKEGLLALFQQEQAQQQQMEQAKMDTEKQKALIAAQGRQQGGPQ